MFCFVPSIDTVPLYTIITYGNFTTVNPQQLIDNLDRDLQYAIQVEGKMDLESVTNYDEVKTTILEKVRNLSLV